MKKFIANPKFTLRKITDEYILIPTQSDGEVCRDIVTVNETVVSVWQMLNQALTKNEIVDMLMEEYEVTQKTAEKDVDELLAVMLSHNLVKAV